MRKKIFLTGASGFIGSALAKRLEEETDHEVAGMYRYVAGDGRYDFYQLDHKIVCDVRDRERVNKVMKQFKPDVVIHLAAMSAVSYSFLSPIEVTQVTYEGTMNIMDACVTNKVGRVINASTSEFYGYQDNFPILETAVPKPLSPYAVAKLAAEEYIRFLRRTDNLPYITIRPYNTYNRSKVGKQYFVIERAITQGLRDRAIHLYTPHPVRDLLDRDSHVDAYMKAIEAGEECIGEEINIGMGFGITIGEAVDMVADIIKELRGFRPEINWNMQPDRPHDIHTLVCSNQKAKQLLGWEPLMPQREGFELAVKEWAEVLGL